MNKKDVDRAKKRISKKEDKVLSAMKQVNEAMKTINAMKNELNNEKVELTKKMKEKSKFNNALTKEEFNAIKSLHKLGLSARQIATGISTRDVKRAPSTILHAFKILGLKPNNAPSGGHGKITKHPDMVRKEPKKKKDNRPSAMKIFRERYGRGVRYILEDGKSTGRMILEDKIEYDRIYKEHCVKYRKLQRNSKKLKKLLKQAQSRHGEKGYLTDEGRVEHDEKRDCPACYREHDLVTQEEWDNYKLDNQRKYFASVQFLKKKMSHGGLTIINQKIVKEPVTSDGDTGIDIIDEFGNDISEAPELTEQDKKYLAKLQQRRDGLDLEIDNIKKKKRNGGVK